MHIVRGILMALAGFSGVTMLGLWGLGMTGEGWFFIVPAVFILSIFGLGTTKISR